VVALPKFFLTTLHLQKNRAILERTARLNNPYPMKNLSAAAIR